MMAILEKWWLIVVSFMTIMVMVSTTKIEELESKLKADKRQCQYLLDRKDHKIRDLYLTLDIKRSVNDRLRIKEGERCGMNSYLS